MTDADKGWIEI